jgi:pyruvate/2-oxoglutarate/acetoin dehydrogenase E1 component
MIRDNGPGVLLLPVKLMKTRGPLEVDTFLPLHKATLQHRASDDAVARGKAVTVLTYLHGTKESEDAIETLKAEGYDVDLVELTCLKPFDKETVETSLKRTHKLAMLDESTRSGGDAVRRAGRARAAPVHGGRARALRHGDGEGDGEARRRPRGGRAVDVLKRDETRRRENENEG